MLVPHRVYHRYSEWLSGWHGAGDAQLRLLHAEGLQGGGLGGKASLPCPPAALSDSRGGVRGGLAGPVAGGEDPFPHTRAFVEWAADRAATASAQRAPTGAAKVHSWVVFEDSRTVVLSMTGARTIRQRQRLARIPQYPRKSQL